MSSNDRISRQLQQNIQIQPIGPENLPKIQKERVCKRGGAANFQVFADFLRRWGGEKINKWSNTFLKGLTWFGLNLHHHISRFELNQLFQDQNGTRTAGPDPVRMFSYIQK